MMRLPNDSEGHALNVGDRVVHSVGGMSVDETGTVVLASYFAVCVEWDESGLIGSYSPDVLRKVSGPCKPTL